jgi:hypothetical protein
MLLKTQGIVFASGARIRGAIAAIGFVAILLALAPSERLTAKGEKHAGVKLECFAITIQPDSITVLNKKGQELTILSSRDYTSLINRGAPLTLWYTNQGGVLHLEDIDLPKESVFLPGEDIRTGLRSIIILPTSEDVEDCQGLFGAIGKYLQDNAGWTVTPAERAEEIEKGMKSPATTLDAIAPQTGQVDIDRLMETRGNLAAEVAAEAHVDAMLEIKVEKVKAHVDRDEAKWDDMTEVIASKKTRALAAVTGVGGLEALGGKSWVYAATVDLNLWSRTGKLLWNKRRGFAALGYQVGVGIQYRPRPLTEVYADHEAMQRWLATTLGKLAPPGDRVANRPSSY